MDTVKDIAQIIYDVARSVAGPRALIEFVKARKRDRLANEYTIYDELDNRFFEYRKLAPGYYDLDILDVPNSDPSLSFERQEANALVESHNRVQHPNPAFEYLFYHAVPVAIPVGGGGVADHEMTEGR